MENSKELTLLTNKQWSVIDGQFCLVKGFVPMTTVNDGEVASIDKTSPLASLHLVCSKLPNTQITGFICHKIDFLNLWKAFKERGINSNEEVIIAWSAKHYKNALFRFMSPIMPRLWVMICPKGAYELITNPDSKPELTGEARAKASLPIIDWKPEVME